MNRPIYETQEHRRKEEKTIKIFSLRMGCEPHKLPRMYKMDYAIVSDNDKIQGFCEVKNRTRGYSDFPTYRLSAKKFLSALQLGVVFHLPCYLVVRFSNGIYYTDLCSLRGSVILVLGGRKDRNDPQDIEPMVQFNINQFTLLQP